VATFPSQRILLRQRPRNHRRPDRPVQRCAGVHYVAARPDSSRAPQSSGFIAAEPPSHSRAVAKAIVGSCTVERCPPQPTKSPGRAGRSDSERRHSRFPKRTGRPLGIKVGYRLSPVRVRSAPQTDKRCLGQRHRTLRTAGDSAGVAARQLTTSAPRRLRKLTANAAETPSVTAKSAIAQASTRARRARRS